MIAVVQARMGSSRLPGKVLMAILGKPMLWHLVKRLEHVRGISSIIVATSDREQDNRIREFCLDHEFSFFCGNEDDVLDRFYQAAKNTDASEVIRITGDCPLVDSRTISELIEKFRSDQLDFCGVATGAGVASEHGINRYPDGLDAEIMKFEVLEQAWSEAQKPFEREHVTPFIWKRPDRFKIGTLYAHDRDYSNYRWTVDNREDFELIFWVYEQLYPADANFGLTDVANLMDRFPEMIEKNKHYLGREGYEQI